jgi:predicted metal-binding membrane protein
MIELARRDKLALISLAAASTLAWVGLSRSGHSMGLVPFLGGWTLMMAAMMLSSIAPLVLLLHRGNRFALASGYLTVWAASGLLPWAAMQWSFQPEPAIVLALAGIYELTPVKQACLRRCHSAASFLMERYKSGPFRLGMEHGLWCAGCCAGLMVVLVLAASMNLAWAAGIAVVVFLQKVLPWPKASARVTGAALLGLALVSIL